MDVGRELLMVIKEMGYGGHVIKTVGKCELHGKKYLEEEREEDSDKSTIMDY